MNKQELNEIIKNEFLYPVYVSDLVYPEVEMFYLSSPKITKYDVAEFYQSFDYQGIRNALIINSNMIIFKFEMLNNIIDGKPTQISPSQKEFLDLLGWQVDKMNFELSSPWVCKEELI
jgi:hypothetical protein